jgi:hypothetical protein
LAALVDAAERLVHGELPDLLDAIDAADHAIEELRDGRREWTVPTPSLPPMPAPPVDRYFERPADAERKNVPDPPSQPPLPALPVRRNVANVVVAWQDVREKLLNHTWRGLRKVVQGCQALAGSPERRAEVEDRVEAALREHVELAEHLAVLRREAVLALPVKKELLAVCSAFEAHRVSEESELFPETLGGPSPLGPSPAQETSDDVARRLRNSLPPMSARELPPPKKGFAALVDRIRGR